MPTAFVSVAQSALTACLLTLTPLLAQVQPETRTLVTLEGQKVKIPAQPSRIACLYYPAYDRLVMLKRTSSIAVMPQATPWGQHFFPEIKKAATITAGTVPDAERLLALHVDLVIYPKGMLDPSKITQAGIAAICPFNDQYRPNNFAEYQQEFKRQILFFGEVLGGDAKTQAEKYCQYFDRLTNRIQAITAHLQESQKPKVYYSRGTDFCSTQGGNTIMRWFTELAGGIYLPKQFSTYFAQVNQETLMAWNPDVVLLGGFGPANATPQNFPARALKAQQNGKVYRLPIGIFYWDLTCCETALLPLFLGKKFHPEAFKDWDLIQEMKFFYSEIYGVRITTQEAERILNGLGPN